MAIIEHLREGWVVTVLKSGPKAETVVLIKRHLRNGVTKQNYLIVRTLWSVILLSR